MADLKRWFKVWTSLLVDMDNLSDDLVGKWTRLGCRIALVGNAGTVQFDNWDHLARFFRVTVEDAAQVLLQLPGLSIDGGEKRDAAISVTMKKWHTYQEDSTAKERMRTLRAKRRGDKKRKEVTAVEPGDFVVPVTTRNGPTIPEPTRGEYLTVVERLQAKVAAQRETPP
jgi:hypothetical protein